MAHFNDFPVVRPKDRVTRCQAASHVSTSIKSRLRKRRCEEMRDKGATTAEIAEALGIHVGSVQRLLRGKVVEESRAG